MPKAAKHQQGVQRRRSPTLTQERVEGIGAIIREWQGRLTWESLCETVERKMGARYTRQALHNHVPIRAAYEAYRKEPAPANRREEMSPEERQIQELRRNVREFGMVRDALLEKFARWSYNAATRGLDEEFLDQPLPRIDRSESR